MNRKYPHVARKRFGQNFLKDQEVIVDIVEAIHPDPETNLVEIGPGLGALTLALLPKVSKLFAIEIDRDVAKLLMEEISRDYPSYLTRFDLRLMDALQFDFTTLAKDCGHKLRIVGNLPYNISTPLLFHLLDHNNSIEDMHFMLQREVAQRMIAKPGSKDYGRLSVMIQYFCEANLLFLVPPEAFRPRPKVMSALIRLKPKAHTMLNAKHFSLFKTLVSTAFQHRRKTIHNALEQYVNTENFSEAGIDPNIRPERMSMEEFVRLSNIVGDKLTDVI